jgi:3-hydroxyisobutyrate dehydrogenase-like beta-hydroxyacid dehydrogenase
MRPMIISGDSSEVPFFIENAFKDIEYYRAMATGSGASQGIADSVAAAILPAINEGHGRDYIPELARFLQRKTSA